MSKQNEQPLQVNDFVMALQEMGTTIDVSIDDLMLLHQKAARFSQALQGESVTTAESMDNNYAMALKDMDYFIDITIEDLILIEEKADKYARMRRRGGILVEELMTRSVKTIQTDASLSEAAHLLITEKISGLPVVDEENKLLGIVTEADFLRALGVPAHHASHSVWQTLENMFSSPAQVCEPYDLVSDLMVTDVITAKPQQTLYQVLDIMKENQIKRLIVCDNANQVVGIITRSDLVRLFFDYFIPSKNKV